MRKGQRWTFLESSEFQQASKTHLSEAEVDALKELIPRYPRRWIELKDAPGLFALHWGVRAPVTIVFAIAPDARKVYLLGIEVGRRYTVTEEVKRQLPALLRRLERLGTRVLAGFGARELIRWMVEHWPF